MQSKQLTKRFVGIVLLTTLAACGPGNTSSSSEKESREKLVVQFVPINSGGNMEAGAKPFAKYLSKKLDHEVEVTLATNYSTIVEATSSGQVNVGIIPPIAYVQTKDAGAAGAILTSQLGGYDQETGLPLKSKLMNTFERGVLVRANSGLDKLANLKGKNIATLDPNSISGYICPIIELKDVGIDPTTDTKMTTVGDIPSEIAAVLNKQVDMAFVFEDTRSVFASNFPDNGLFRDLRVLYLTKGGILNDTIAVQPDMSKDLKAKVKETFLNMKGDEDGKEAMVLWRHQGYEETADSAYDTIRDYTKKATK